MRSPTRIVRSGECDPPNLELAIKNAKKELEREGATVMKIDRRPKEQIAYISYKLPGLWWKQKHIG